MREEIHFPVRKLDAHDRLNQVLRLQALQAFRQDLLCDIRPRPQRFGPDSFALDLIDVVVEKALVGGQSSHSVG